MVCPAVLTHGCTTLPTGITLESPILGRIPGYGGSSGATGPPRVYVRTWRHVLPDASPYRNQRAGVPRYSGERTFMVMYGVIVAPRPLRPACVLRAAPPAFGDNHRLHVAWKICQLVP